MVRKESLHAMELLKYSYVIVDESFKGGEVYSMLIDTEYMDSAGRYIEYGDLEGLINLADEVWTGLGKVIKCKWKKGNG